MKKGNPPYAFTRKQQKETMDILLAATCGSKLFDILPLDEREELVAIAMHIRKNISK